MPIFQASFLCEASYACVSIDVHLTVKVNYVLVFEDLGIGGSEHPRNRKTPRDANKI